MSAKGVADAAREAAVTFQVYHHEETPISMSPGLLLFFGLHGDSELHTVRNSYTLAEDEVYIASPLTLYRLGCKEDAALLSMSVAPELLRRAGWEENTTADCLLPSEKSSDAAHNAVRRGIAAVFRSLFREDESASETAALAVELVRRIRQDFAGTDTARASASAETMTRIEQVLRFVQKHWAEPITLAELAAQQFLSESYLSRLFHKCLDMTFTDYLVSVRLEHAEADLRKTQYSITQIAYQNGFKSTNAFIEYFRRRYGVTPGKYRKTAAVAQTGANRSSPGDLSDWMQVLLQYEETPQRKGRSAGAHTLTLSVDAAQEGRPVQPSWRRLMNIGYARDGLIGTVQEQIKRAKREIGFTDLRFHGIFDDDMHIYQQNEDGSPWYNFTYADLLFDFILSVGLHPYVELGFVPSKMAKVQYRLFERCSIAGTYAERELWEALVQATVAHWIERYGLEEVQQWRFTILSFNYSQLSTIPMDYADYLDMYCTTWRILKELDPGLRMGGPGSFPSISLAEDSGKRLLHDLTARGCPPDFLTVQMYPHENIEQDAEFLRFTANQQSTPSILSKDEDFVRHFLQSFRKVADVCGLSDREIVIEEWSSTLWQRDLSSDTCYKAAWLTKNALENCGNVDVLGYWLLTDFIDEWLVPGGVFHGGYGLFTTNGIPKAGYQALRLLTRVGEREIGHGPGWFVSKSRNAIQIFLYHYCHYDALYRYRYQKLTNPHDAYKVFRQDGELRIALTLTGLHPGGYRQERRRISRKAGSAYDKWLEIGAPSKIGPDDLRYLSETSQPSYAICESDTDGQLLVETTLGPHEVEMIILQRRDC